VAASTIRLGFGLMSGVTLQSSTIRRRFEHRQIAVAEVTGGGTFFERASREPPSLLSVADDLALVVLYQDASEAAGAFAGAANTIAMLHSANALIVWSGPQPHPAQLRLLEECVFGKNAEIQAGPRVAGDVPQEEPFAYFFWPPRDYQPDPATIYDPRPLLTEVKNIMKSAYREIFGGAEQTSDGAIRVGVTGPAPLPVSEVLLAALPDAVIEVHPVKYTWSRLLTIANELGTRMAADTTIVSVAPDEQQNTVRVGVTDLDAEGPQTIVAYYGDAIELFSDSAGVLLGSDSA
jgi:hypothetical protein